MPVQQHLVLGHGIEVADNVLVHHTSPHHVHDFGVRVDDDGQHEVQQEEEADAVEERRIDQPHCVHLRAERQRPGWAKDAVEEDTDRRCEALELATLVAEEPVAKASKAREDDDQEREEVQQIRKCQLRGLGDQLYARVRAAASDHPDEEDNGEQRSGDAVSLLPGEELPHDIVALHEVPLQPQQILLAPGARPIEAGQAFEGFLGVGGRAPEPQEDDQNGDKADEAQHSIKDRLHEALPVDRLQCTVDLHLLASRGNHVDHDEEQEEQGKNEEGVHVDHLIVLHGNIVLNLVFRRHAPFAGLKIDGQHGGDAKLHRIEDCQDLDTLGEEVEVFIGVPEDQLPLPIHQLVPHEHSIVCDREEKLHVVLLPLERHG
mmetsp:Transcript_63394/g.147688  ORF Transcript_63394/g.147688 Transcript_63394/m.147688 type:complete len:375 (-) Transcript_63394:825-1949(-)